MTTKQQLQAELAQVQAKALELQKQIDTFVEPVFVFEEGSFIKSVNTCRYYPTSLIQPEWDSWLQSFFFLADKCTHLGGRVMSKPNDEKTWYSIDYDLKKKEFSRTECWSYARTLFNFPNRNLRNQFLSTEGVKENWLLFMQVDTNKS